MIRVYRSLDDGALYLGANLDAVPPDPEQYQTYEIPEVVTLTAEQLAIGQNEVMEVLIGAGQAKRVQ